MALVSSLDANDKSHLTASTLAWRWRVVFTFWEQAKTNPPLQSLTTTALGKNFVLTATSTLNLTETCLGTKADLKAPNSHKSHQQIWNF